MLGLFCEIFTGAWIVYQVAGAVVEHIDRKQARALREAGRR